MILCVCVVDFPVAEAQAQAVCWMDATLYKASIAQLAAALAHWKSGLWEYSKGLLRELQAKLLAQKAEAARVDPMLLSAKASLEQQLAKGDAIEAELQQAKEEAAKVGPLESEVERLQGELDKSVKQATDHAAALEAANTEVKQLEQEVATAGAAQEEVSRLQKELEEAKRDGDAKETELETLQQEVNQLNQQLAAEPIKATVGDTSGEPEGVLHEEGTADLTNFCALPYGQDTKAEMEVTVGR